MEALSVTRAKDEVFFLQIGEATSQHRADAHLTTSTKKFNKNDWILQRDAQLLPRIIKLINMNIIYRY